MFQNTPYLHDLNVKFWLTICTVIGTNSHRGIVDVLQLSGLCPRLVRRGLGHSALLYCTTLAVLQPGQGSCITLLAVVFHCASLSFRIRRHACYKNLRATDWEGSQIIIFAVFFSQLAFQSVLQFPLNLKFDHQLFSSVSSSISISVSSSVSFESSVSPSVFFGFLSVFFLKSSFFSGFGHHFGPLLGPLFASFLEKYQKI